MLLKNVIIVRFQKTELKVTVYPKGVLKLVSKLILLLSLMGCRKYVTL